MCVCLFVMLKDKACVRPFGVYLFSPHLKTNTFLLRREGIIPSLGVDEDQELDLHFEEKERS